MSRDIQIKNTFIDKTQLSKLIDTSFTYFKSDDIDNRNIITIDEFFELYETLYLEIPIEGVNSSHEYLVKKSGEMLELIQDDSRVTPLLEEIAELREQLLLANETIIELQTKERTDEQ